MKRKVVFSSVIVITITAVCFYLKWDELKYYFKLGNTSVAVLNNRIDLGVVSVRDSIPVQFKILNSGSNDLKIKQVIPSCECTVVDLSSDIVIPNDTLVVNILFKPEKIGKIEKDIVLDVNSAPPFIGLSFYGEVVK